MRPIDHHRQRIAGAAQSNQEARMTGIFGNGRYANVTATLALVVEESCPS